jgi:AmmeMemoRadiSam system protein B
MPIIPNEEKPHKARDYKPSLRPIEVFPVKIENQEALCLRDPARISPEPLFLTSTAGLFLPLLNGQNDLRDIQAALMRRLGRLIESEVIENLIEKLDESLFLEGERFDRYLLDLKTEFAGNPIRGAALAGLSYESDPVALSRQLEAYYDHPAGPGLAEKPVSSTPVRGLIAPHIDFERGGPCYAWTYKELQRVGAPPKLVVILGTAHSPMNGYLNLCDKDFETPFGLVKCEKDLAEEISNELGAATAADSFIHRGEHSVEFQAVWLKSVFQGSDDLRILPFLCGSLIPLIESERHPAEVEEYTRTLDTLKEILDQWGKANGPVMILASVDLSHVGPQFGHEFRVTEDVRRNVRDHDTGLLETAIRGDYDGFFRLIADELDIYNVCGVASIYAMLRLLGQTEGSVLSYDQWVDEEGGGLVSFASLAFSAHGGG